MSEQTLKPERITKPIQLLAAWLAGLFSIDSAFLFAATRMEPGWQAGALTVAAIVNVPLFLSAVFLLQTRFRPELQEDSYYSSYLSRKTNELIQVKKDDTHVDELRQRIFELEAKVLSPTQPGESNRSALAHLVFGVNKHLVDRRKIGARLAERGIETFTTFGSDEAPTRRTVAISKYLVPEVVQEVVRLARELGFTSYSFFDNRAEDAEEEVLLGSYGAGGYEIASLEDKS